MKSKFLQKIKEDLNQGVRVMGIHPDYLDVIRVWTKKIKSNDNHPNKFLLIATARQGLTLPISSLEMHAFSPGDQSWRMHLNKHPFPEPHWRISWKILHNTYPIKSADEQTRQLVIKHYLRSEFDKESTQDIVDRHKFKDERISWEN